jgi:hypothetical protein
LGIIWEWEEDFLAPSWPSAITKLALREQSALRTFFEQKNYTRFRQHFSAVIER